ncbi:GCN5-related N-acetyltransferase family protein [Methanocella paludicola SANAE]|uniref:GCN5-related N-acetyltransferase family protein n=1 Tax=Methanocella paludicola (strain DSM 17711 / JCM 13418 / NBRC 101707 / SANAE) TaxID=304371 RepID=D1YYH9_METPS|nr:GNAT family N-acetyltransferase [Methanocella paludicola]BAI61501.1 GCN5-related N-acetyltransferase family protein [Methanocella paludicola SANAE]
MAHKEDKGMKIRHAGLDDAAGICDVHKSHIERWYRKLGAEHVDVAYKDLSIGERWGFGGPWMSAETCSVHLNNLLLQHQFPFVALDKDRPVGETEFFVGDEGPHFGKTLHIGLLYVLKKRSGHGIGSALVDKAVRFATDQGCDTVTVASAMANVGFYEKCGFTIEGRMVELEASTKEYDVDIVKLPPPMSLWAFTRGLPMPVGRYQSSAFHVFEQLDQYAVPEFMDCRRDRVFVKINGHPSMLAFTRYDTVPERADVYGWSEAGAEAVAKAALTLLHKEGVRYATILLDGDDYYAIADSLDAAVKGSRGSLLRRLRK